MILPVTLTIAAAAAIVNIWLSIRCAQARMRAKVLIGDGGDALLTARMRAQSNLIEYTPIFLILLALVELARPNAAWLWGVGIAHVIGRILHPFGMDRMDANPMRGLGMLLTLVSLIVLVGFALAIPYAGHSLRIMRN